MVYERFMVDDCGTLIDIETRDTFDYVSDVCNLLNELHKENQYLKSLKWNIDCINEISIGIQQRQLLEKENNQLKSKINKLDDRLYSKECDVFDLEKENEQLKQENQRLNQTLEHIQKELNKYNNEWVDL